MGTSERLAARSRVVHEPLRVDDREIDAELSVTEAADVEVQRTRQVVDPEPAE